MNLNRAELELCAPLSLTGLENQKFSFANVVLRRDNPLFFETRWALVHHLHSQASGNPVRIGDGCATVTGYELPRPLVHQTGKAGVRFQARSQDTGLAVLVVVCDASWPPSLNSERQCCV